MFLFYDSPFFDLLFPLVSTLLVPLIFILPYGFWLANKRSDQFTISPFGAIVGLSIFWTLTALVAIGLFGLPENYVDSIRYIFTHQYIKAFYYAQAMIVTTLAFKLIASQFLAIRVAHTRSGIVVAFLVVLLFGTVTAAIIEGSSQSFINRQSLANREALRYVFQLASFVIIVVIVASLDIAAFLATRFRMQESNLPALFTLSLLLPLIGFFLLDIWHATLWLAYLIMVPPVLLALLSTLQGGERFTPKLAFRMFVYQLNALGRLFRRN